MEAEKKEVNVEVSNENRNKRFQETNVENPTKENYKKFADKPWKKPFKKKGISPAASNYPEHMVFIALLIKNNAEIRRFTALGIINYLTQKGEITGEHKYIVFKWNKFTVKYNGLIREYFYTEPFFINCLVASFTSFSASAQKIINNFVNKEFNKNITEAVSVEEVEKIVNQNETKTDSTVTVDVEQ